MQMRKAVRARVYKFDATGEISAGPDSLAGEEPLEIQLNGEQYTVTMRTAGHDVELIAGYLLSEAVVTAMDDIEEVNFSAGIAQTAPGTSTSPAYACAQECGTPRRPPPATSTPPRRVGSVGPQPPMR